MDIAGAKALKERLGHHGRDDAPAAPVNVREGAPPVYHYLGVAETAAAPPEAKPERRRSLLRRLGARRV